MSMQPVRRATLLWAQGLMVAMGLASGVSLSCAAESPAHEHLHPVHAKPAPAAKGSNVLISQAWIRSAVKGQSGTGGFMRLLSPQGGTLLGFESPVATAELHEMAMEGDVMRMRPIKALTLPAGQPVDLKPGSYHLMLVNLKKPLTVGDVVPVNLKLQGPDGKVFKQALKVPVLNAAPAASGETSGIASMPEMGHMGHSHDHAKPAVVGLERMPKERKPQ
jgi:periplasmic copper chaperone A